MIDWKTAPALIETQLPVSRLSKESYKERKAGASQTLTGLGKWWGRKPLVLVRATILASLLPATDNPSKDREIFLRIMRMDDASVFDRQKSSPISAKFASQALTGDKLNHWIELDPKGKEKWAKDRTALEIEHVSRQIFNKLPLDERLVNALRPEEVDDRPYQHTLWSDIKNHWGIEANSLDSLIEALGVARYGHRPMVGDCFCGGGSIPFEAARVGCDAIASDLNPVAGLLTWGALNIVGGGTELKIEIEASQNQWLAKVDAEITAWGIEHNAAGERADAYLYCTETKCPSEDCGWIIPMSPSWLVSEKYDIGVKLIPDNARKTYKFKIATGEKKYPGTVSGGNLICPHCKNSTPIKTIRGDYVVQNGSEKETLNMLRLWEKSDYQPNASDIFRERLYCIRWTSTNTDGKLIRRYDVPNDADLQRESNVSTLLNERFADWQEKGFIPSMRIEPGYNTKQPIWERGWTHWHHLFNTRQLLTHGLIHSTLTTSHQTLTLGRMCDWNSKLSIWLPSRTVGPGGVKNTFMNQSLNTLSNHGCRGFLSLIGLVLQPPTSKLKGKGTVKLQDAALANQECSIWITDPPYADAVNYHELSEFFLAWYQTHLKKHFPEWARDSRRVLAVKGDGDSFVKSMAKIYANLRLHMPINGIQIMMFTHQDPEVWADLAVIIWAAGLKATAAWVIGTETSSGLKTGNYVQGTVLLVLRKRDSDEEAVSSDVRSSVKREVARQIKFMRGIDAGHSDSPDFCDSDYQLAAYGAALKSITSYAAYNGHTPQDALDGNVEAKKSIRKLIDDALGMASELLVPEKLHADESVRMAMWAKMDKTERFYIQCLEAARHGSKQHGVFQDLAKGFGLGTEAKGATQKADTLYKDYFASTKANDVRLKNAVDWGRKHQLTGATGWPGTLTRAALRAIMETSQNQNNGTAGLAWLKAEFGPDFFQKKDQLVHIIRYLSNLPMPEWTADAESAAALCEAVDLAKF